ncbi:MAG: YncE family protein, partial [Fidelibacterota bacterium]
SSGYVAMYDLESDMLIDTVMVGDSPALMTLDKQQMRVYCSRMMPMGGMMSSSVSQVIQQLDYSTGELVPIGEFTVDSPAPHGITLDMDKDQIITASNTADWIYKIDLTSGNVTGQALDSQTYAPPNIEIQRLKPIQCVTVAPDKVLLTCSAGIWMNPYTGEETHIPGTIQLWDVSTMSILDTLQLNWHSKPWHAVKSQSSNKIFIALSGDILAGESAGAACVRYDNNELSFEWVHRSEEFHILHGIDITADESKIFISSRSNGELYTLDGQTGELISTMLLSVNPDMVMAGGVAVMKNN